MNTQDLYRIEEISNLKRIVYANKRIINLYNKKRYYKLLCDKLDILFLELEKINNPNEIDNFITVVLDLHRADMERVFIGIHSDEMWINEYDNSIYKRNQFSLINEELIQKAMSPARLMRHLELGGDIEDF